MLKCRIISTILCLVLLAPTVIITAQEEQTIDEYLRNSIDKYIDFDYADPAPIQAEEFFGVWDKTNGVWLQKGLVNYDTAEGLSPVKEAVMSGNYGYAGAALLEYYKAKFKSQARDIKGASTKMEKLKAVRSLYNIFNQVDVHDMFSVSPQGGYIEGDVTAAVKSVFDSTLTDALTLYLVALEKDGYEAVFHTKEASDYKPYLEVVVNDDLYTLPVDGDTMVRAGNYSTHQYGTDEEMRVCESVSTINTGNTVDDGTKRAYLKFDFSDFKPGDKVTSAKLYLYGQTEKTEGKKLVAIFRDVSTGWNEANVSWGDLTHNVASLDGEPGYIAAEDNHNFFGNIESVIKRYMTDKDELYAYHAIRLLQCFMYVNRLESKWSSNLTLGRRGQRLPEYIYCLIDSEYMTPEVFYSLLRLVYVTANELVQNWDYQSLDSNWGASETVGLFNLALNFNEFYAANEPLTLPGNEQGGLGGWIPVVSHRLDLKAGNLHPDGSYVEDSLGYTDFTLNLLVQALEYAEETGYNEKAYSAESFENINKLTRYMMFMSTPKYGDFQYGDGYPFTVNYGDIFWSVARLTKDPQLTWAATGGKEGEKPEFTSVVYPDSVRAVLRSDWEPDAIALHFNSDGGVGGHGHSDDLAVILTAYGKNLLVDPLYFNYLANPYRAWLSSTRAHNTIEINDISQRFNIWALGEVAQGPKGEPLVLPFRGDNAGVRGEFDQWELNQLYDYIEGETPNYMGPVFKGRETQHKRTILYVKPDCFIVTDHLAPLPENTGYNKYNQTWHTLPDADISIDPVTKTMRTNFEDVNVIVAPVQQKDTLEAIKEEGHYSPAAETVYDAYYTSYVKNVVGSTTFNTVLVPMDNGEDYTVTTETIVTDVEEHKASAFRYEIADKNTPEVTRGWYYNLHDFSKKGERIFDGFRSNGELCLVEYEGEILSNAILQNGSYLKDELQQTNLVYTNGNISRLGIRWEGNTIQLSTSKMKRSELEQITVLCNTTIKKVYFNGEAVGFKQSGKYIYFGDSPIIEDDTVIDNKTENRNSSGTHGKGTPSGGGTQNGGGSGIVPVPSVPTDALPQSMQEQLKNHWGKNEIEAMIRKNVVQGISQSSLGLDLPVTRAEFVTMLVRGLALESVQEDHSFADVGEESWYAPYIKTAYHHGMIAGDGENFYPDHAITREEMAKILVQTVRKMYQDIAVEGGSVEFSDQSQISNWAVEYVIWANGLGLMNGVGNNAFAAKDNALREQAIVVLYRTLEKLDFAYSN